MLVVVVCRCLECDSFDEAVEVVAFDAPTLGRLESLPGTLLDLCGCPGAGLARVESVTLIEEARRAA